MSQYQVSSLLGKATHEDLVAHLRVALDVPSPYIGAQGPPNQDGPECPFVAYLKSAEPQNKRRFGKALNSLLLHECTEVDSRGIIPAPLLLFNVLRLLQEYALTETRPSLLALVQGEQKNLLHDALLDKGEDLFEHALLALAVTQPNGGDTDFWKRLLLADNREYAKIAVAGIREAGWRESCQALPLIAQRYKVTGWGDIQDVVQLLVYYYPEENWPYCAEPYCNEDDHPELWMMLRRHKNRLENLTDSMHSRNKKILRLDGIITSGNYSEPSFRTSLHEQVNCFILRRHKKKTSIKSGAAVLQSVALFLNPLPPEQKAA
jgi:hypothetical protein